jgi:predicted nucleic acid-binding Zn ribbon protein
MMTDTTDDVTDKQSTCGTFLPLHHREVWKTVPYFYCSKCGRENQFSWSYAYCTESGEVLCLGHELGWKLCRRCRQPRRIGKDISQFSHSETVCNGCQDARPHHEPLRMVCGQCGKPFTAKRSDARFCSNSCRQAMFRLRRRQHAT